MSDEELLTQDELCQWLKITPMTAYRWRKDGMPYMGKGRFIRYRKSEVEKWLNEREK